MKVFLDLHHSDLYYSLYLLLEKRLGFELYRPIGMDWFYEGYWKIAEPYNNALDTVGQYLNVDRTPFINGSVNNNFLKDEIYFIYDPAHKYHQRAIEFEKFKSIKFDIILSTFHAHDYVFETLKNLHQPNAKLIAHMGNTFQTTHLKNVIHSVPYKPKDNQNCIYIHQEIDTNIYNYTQPDKLTKNIYSVTNLMPYTETYYLYKSLLNEFNFKYYGIGCVDGVLNGTLGVYEKMRESNIGLSLKPLGGLGHSNMGWFYSGRGLITNMSQHKIYGEDALKYFEPDVTCIDIDGDTVEENCKKIRKWMMPENTIKLGENAKRRFHEIINYDYEELEFRKFLENII